MMLRSYGTTDFLWSIREPVKRGLRVRIGYVAQDQWNLWGTVTAVQPGFWDWERDKVPLTVLLDDGRIIETNTRGVRYQYRPTQADLDEREGIFLVALVGCLNHEPVGTPAFWYDEDGLQDVRIIGRHMVKNSIIRAFDHWYYVLDFRIETGRWAGLYCYAPASDVKRINRRFRKLDGRQKVVGVW